MSLSETKFIIIPYTDGRPETPVTNIALNVAEIESIEFDSFTTTSAGVSRITKIRMRRTIQRKTLRRPSPNAEPVEEVSTTSLIYFVTGQAAINLKRLFAHEDGGPVVDVTRMASFPTVQNVQGNNVAAPPRLAPMPPAAALREPVQTTSDATDAELAEYNRQQSRQPVRPVAAPPSFTPKINPAAIADAIRRRGTQE